MAFSRSANLMAKNVEPKDSGRRSSVSSDDSGASSTIDYEATNSFDPPDSPVEPRTVRKGKDYRPASTFYKKSYWDMTFSEKICHLATCPTELHEVKSESTNRGPVPTQPIWIENIFILSRALPPILLQAASYHFFPDFKWQLPLAYAVYFLSFIAFAIAVVGRMNYYCTRLGTFDEKNFSRDRTPDKSVNGLAKGILLYMLYRTALPFFLYWNPDANPLSSFTWSYPIRAGLLLLALDYFFYVYHRTTHEVDSLWFIHSHHHTTKHPTAILAILAGDYQEVLEIAIVPTLASLLVPMSFSELYVTMCYTIYVEMLGHSGVRSHWAHPILGWILKPLDMDLAVEDHELHHRFGKSGKNYGKQSRVYDKIFGTVGERIETYGH